MNQWIFLVRRVLIAAIVLVAGLSTVGLRTVAAAEADDSASATTIEPYTGPPMFLDEPEPPPPPKLVKKEIDSAKYEDGTVRIEREVAIYSDNHPEAEGFYREFYPDGQKFVEGQYHSGLQTGKWTYWHPNGKVNREVTYRDGQPDGSWEVHNADGKLITQRSYKDGKRDGKWVIFDEAGEQKLREENYKDAKPDGEWKFWFPTGKLKSQMTFRAGLRDGPATEFYESGEKRIEVTYVDGKLDGIATVWMADGKKVTQEYDEGKLLKQTQE